MRIGVSLIGVDIHTSGVEELEILAKSGIDKVIPETLDKEGHDQYGVAFLSTCNRL